jgi:hypothetical protein
MIPEHIDPDLLADNADATAEEMVLRYFTEDEIVEYKNLLADCHIQTAQRKKLVTDINLLMAEDIENEIIKDTIINIIDDAKIEGYMGYKSLKAEIKNISGYLNSRSVEKKETVYLFYHRDITKTATYNKLGQLMYVRPMTESERQSTIFEVIKNHKNGTHE